MKKFNKKLIILFILVIMLTGCTKTLTKNNKPVKNPVTGQSLTENILCKPTDKNIIKIYEENKKDISKLPDCTNYKVNSGKYEGIWTTIFVKPLAWLILKIGNFVKNNGLSLIIVSLLIRLIAFPITKKTAMQSEYMKKAKPELIGLTQLLSKPKKRASDTYDSARKISKVIPFGSFIRNVMTVVNQTIIIAINSSIKLRIK